MTEELLRTIQTLQEPNFNSEESRIRQHALVCKFYELTLPNINEPEISQSYREIAKQIGNEMDKTFLEFISENRPNIENVIDIFPLRGALALDLGDCILNKLNADESGVYKKIPIGIKRNGPEANIYYPEKDSVADALSGIGRNSIIRIKDFGIATGGSVDDIIDKLFSSYRGLRSDQIVVFDNLENGHTESIEKVREITGKEIELVKGDLRVKADVEGLLKNSNFDGVIHFAAYPDISLSVRNPGKYFWNNIVGSVNLLDSMLENNINNIVFSSTSEVYGNAPNQPITEDMPRIPTNMYGESKRMVEVVMENYSNVNNLKFVTLRYFNAAGADIEGRIGEDHRPELHLIPSALKGVLGLEEFKLTSAKVDTKDGTTVRDYVHVLDLASSHLRSLEYLMDGGESDAFNVGTGKGNSVLEIVSAIEKVTGKKLEPGKGETRKGEPAIKYADTSKIEKKLGWKAEYTIEDIIESAYKWHKASPEGY